VGRLQDEVPAAARNEAALRVAVDAVAASRAEPTGMARGKKEQQAELARQAARGKYQPPPPPRLSDLH
jgi:hypothetical protein